MTDAGSEPVLVARNGMTGRIESVCLPGHWEEPDWRQEEEAKGWRIETMTLDAMLAELDDEEPGHLQ